MKQELDLNYDISVDNMVDISPRSNEWIKGFDIKKAEFFNRKGKRVIKDVLFRVNGHTTEQIFQMKDGLFILEVEEDGEITYFYSDNINDITN